MATWEDIRRVMRALPETTERVSAGTMQWRVKEKLVAWERPLRRADHEALGASAPEGPILGVRTPDVGVKEALLADDPGVYFTTPHFDGYPAVLVRLEAIDVAELEEVLVEAWITQAPKRLARDYLSATE